MPVPSDGGSPRCGLWTKGGKVVIEVHRWTAAVSAVGLKPDSPGLSGKKSKNRSLPLLTKIPKCVFLRIVLNL